jgi:hypothetical protein
MAETEIFFSVKKSRGGGYEARALGHSIFTQAETMHELRANVTEAVACHFGDRKVSPPIRLVRVRAKGPFSAQQRPSSRSPMISTTRFPRMSKIFSGNKSAF